MTLAPPDERLDDDEEELQVDDEPTPSVREPPRDGLRRGVGIVFVVAIVLGFSIWLFQGPIAGVWYDSRQRGLARELAQPTPRIGEGDAFATLQIPVLGLNLVVVQGDDPSDLRAGPGHRIDTPAPGKRGNSLVFGHRAGWGGPFADVSTLKRNDVIVTKLRKASDVTVFKVIRVAHVSSDDVALLAPSTDYRLTLVTGAQGWRSTDLVVVSAVSGDPGRLRAPPPRLHADNTGSLFDSTLVIGIGAVIAAIVCFVALHKNGRGALAIAAVVVPLGAAAWLAIMLSAGHFLPPYR